MQIWFLCSSTSFYTEILLGLEREITQQTEGDRVRKREGERGTEEEVATQKLHPNFK